MPPDQLNVITELASGHTRRQEVPAWSYRLGNIKLRYFPVSVEPVQNHQFSSVFKDLELNAFV